MFLNNIRQRLNNSLPKPPGPSQFEILNEFSRSNFLEFLSHGSSKLMRKYGDIIRLPNNQYLICNPNAFKHILKTNVNNFSKINMTYNRLKLIFGDGLITNEGPVWEQHRAILHPVFDRTKLEQYAPLMVNTTTEWMQKWQQKLPRSIDISKEMSELTLKIAFRAFSNYEPSAQELNTVSVLFKRGNPHVSHAPILTPWFPTPNNLLFFSALRNLNKLLEKIINQRQTMKEYIDDVIGILLSAKQSNGKPLSEFEVLNEYKTLLITGYETTGCGLAWAHYLLATHPEYQGLMETELKTVLNGRLPTIHDCIRLPVTKAIFLEALRLYPSIWCLPRVVLKPDTIGGYPIAEKSLLILNIYALHRNPLYWESPEVFYPPRFLNDAENKRHLFSYLPFSIGPHSCIGSIFGIMEGILLLATIGQKFRFEILKKNKTYKAIPYASLKLPENLKMRPIAIS